MTHEEMQKQLRIQKPVKLLKTGKNKNISTKLPKGTTVQPQGAMALNQAISKTVGKGDYIHKTMSDPKRPVSMPNTRPDMVETTIRSGNVIRGSSAIDRITGIKRGAMYPMQVVKKSSRGTVGYSNSSSMISLPKDTYVPYERNYTPLGKSVIRAGEAGYDDAINKSFARLGQKRGSPTKIIKSQTRKIEIKNSGFDPNYVPYQRTPLPDAVSRSARLISKIKSASGVAGKVIKSPVGRRIGEVSSAIAKSGLPRAVGMAGMAYGVITDLGQIARASVEIGRAVRHKPIVANVTGVQEQRRANQKPSVRIVEHGKVTPIKFVNTLAKIKPKITSAPSSKVSKSGKTPRPLQAQTPEIRTPRNLTGVDIGLSKSNMNLGFLKVPKPQILASRYTAPKEITPMATRLSMPRMESPSMSMAQQSIDAIWRRRLKSMGR